MRSSGVSERPVVSILRSQMTAVPSSPALRLAALAARRCRRLAGASAAEPTRQPLAAAGRAGDARGARRCRRPAGATRSSLPPSGPGSLAARRQPGRSSKSASTSGAAAGRPKRCAPPAPRSSTSAAATRRSPSRRSPPTSPRSPPSPRVAGVTEVLAPIVRWRRLRRPGPLRGRHPARVASARADFGVDGDRRHRRHPLRLLRPPTRAPPTHAAGDVASGDLPGPGSPCGSTQPVGVLADSRLRRHRRGPGDGADRPRPRARRRDRLRHRLQRRTAFAANIRALAAAGAAGDRRRRRLLRRAVLPGRPGRGRGRRSHRRRRHLLLRRRQRQPDRRPASDIASWEAPSSATRRICPARRAAGARRLHGLRPGRGGTDPHLRHHASKPGENSQLDLQWAEPAAGSRPTSTPTCSSDGGNVLAKATNHNVTGDRSGRSSRSAWENEGGAADRPCRLVDHPLLGQRRAPRVKFVQLGERPTASRATEYRNLRRRHDRPDGLRPRRLPPARSPSAPSTQTTTVGAGGVLLARAGDPLLRAGRRRRAGGAAGDPEVDRQARPRRDRRRRHHLLLATRRRRSGASSAPRPRPRTPPRSPPWCGRRTPGRRRPRSAPR